MNAPGRIGPESVEAWSGKDRGDENFPVGSHLVARQYREPIHRYYAFARNADDIADSATLAPEEKIARLDVMEDVLLGRRDQGSPSAAALRTSLARTGVTPRHATDLLIAFRQDATQSRYGTIDDLCNYCRYSAMPVGRYVLDVHHEDRKSWSPSDALCMSLQILNHLQDCTKDLAQLDRCYLPRELLDQFGATIDDLRQPAETPALRHVFATLLDRANSMNMAAVELPKVVRDRRLRMETAMIVRLSKRLHRHLSSNDPVAGRVKLRKADFLLSGIASVFSLL